MGVPARTTRHDDGGVTAVADATWLSWAGVHGGLVMSLAADAAADLVDKPLRTATRHFAARVVADVPITFTARELAAGCSRSTVLVEARQGDELVLAGLFGFFAAGSRWCTSRCARRTCRGAHPGWSSWASGATGSTAGRTPAYVPGGAARRHGREHG